MDNAQTPSDPNADNAFPVEYDAENAEFNDDADFNLPDDDAAFNVPDAPPPGVPRGDGPAAGPESGSDLDSVGLEDTTREGRDPPS